MCESGPTPLEEHGYSPLRQEGLMSEEDNWDIGEEEPIQVAKPREEQSPYTSNRAEEETDDSKVEEDLSEEHPVT